MGGASGAGGLLLNTKASQEAACSRAPAAIVPDHKPARDAGVSRSGESGSHLAATGAAEGHAVQVACSGSSGNAGIGSHLAVASVTDAAGTHAAVVAAARCTAGVLVADKCLTISEIMICPVWFC